MEKLLKQSLKAKAHHLKPVLLLGAKGLTEAVIQEADLTLQAHELIKVKLHVGEKTQRQAIISTLCERLGADLVQCIGNIAVIYRKKEE